MRRFANLFFRAGPIAIAACCLCVGCADTNAPTTQPQSMRARQDSAIADPYGYKTDVPSVTGDSGTSKFDKQGFDRDVHDLVNP